jgi:predicted nucleotidyltransferase
MVPLVEHQLDALAAVCGRHGVARLEIFGSAANPADFDPARSDVDFIVSFCRGFDLGPWLAHYFDLQEEFEQILQRPVEIVMESAMQNPLFKRDAARKCQVVNMS